MTFDLARELDLAPRLFDGAVGTQLLVSGFDRERDLLGDKGPLALNLTRPEQVRAVHESYLDAGSHWITTNTFAASPADLAQQGLSERGDRLVDAAVNAAREAVDAWRGDVPDARVLGSIGPGWTPDATAANERAADALELARRLVEGGVDGLLLETVTRLDHLRVVYASLRELADRAGLAVIASVAFGPDGRLADGASAADVAAWAKSVEPVLLGANCGRGPDGTERDLAALREHWSGPLAARPTAGLPVGDDLSTYPVGAEAFADRVAPWIERFDLVALGGCCGTSPRHLAQVSDALGLERHWVLPDEDDEEFDDDGGEA
jgi:5-methyltetrahydrofolate--homocysteine methyltransferase